MTLKIQLFSWLSVNTLLVFLSLILTNEQAARWKNLFIAVNLLLAVLWLYLNRGRILRPPSSGVLLLALVAYGGLGVFENKLSGQDNSFFTVFAILALPLLALAAHGATTSESLQRGLNRTLLYVCAATGVVVVQLLMLTFGVLQGDIRTHEKMFFFAAVPVVAYALGHKRLALVSGLLTLALAVIDRRTTGVLMILSTLAVAAVLTSSVKLRRVIVFALLPLGLTAAIAALPTLGRLNRQFKEGVGSVDNSEFRLKLMRDALHAVNDNPVLAERFSGPQGHYTGWYAETPDGYQPVIAPYHSDYMQMLAGGGGLGILLFCTFLLALIYESASGYFRARATDDLLGVGAHLLVLIVTINYAISAAFNPLAGNIQAAFGFCFCVGFHYLLKTRSLRHDSAHP
jgi:hypothetical protein